MAGVLAASKVQPEIGDQVQITGSGFTAAGTVNLTVVQDGEEAMQVNLPLVAAGGIIGGLTIIPGAPGHITVTAHDVTANTDTSLVMQVFET
jgi:hypothetical protein